MLEYSLKYKKEVMKKNKILFETIKKISNENNSLKNEIKLLFKIYENYKKEISEKEMSELNLTKKIRKGRQKPNEEKLTYKCPVEKCIKAYQKQNYLVTHIKLKHKDIYDIPHLKSGRNMGYSHSKLKLDNFKIKNNN